MIFKERQWETDEKLSVLPSTDRNLYDSFDAVAEQDFNPDLVICYGHDAYDEGLKNGLTIAAAVTTAAGLIYAAGKKLYRKIKTHKANKKSLAEFKEEPSE